MTSGNRFLAGLIAGALAGAVAGLLLAPKPGKETRHVVVTRAGELREKAGNYVGTLRAKIRREGTAENLEESSDHQAVTPS